MNKILTWTMGMRQARETYMPLVLVTDDSRGTTTMLPCSMDGIMGLAALGHIKEPRMSLVSVRPSAVTTSSL